MPGGAAGGGGRRVLVAACGTGNAAVELARRGLEVAGFDLSPAMLAWPRPSGQRRRPPLRLVVGDLRAVPVRDGWADLVLVLNASLNYLLEPAEVVTALRHWGGGRARRHGGGRALSAASPTAGARPPRGPRRPAPGRRLRGRGRPGHRAAALEVIGEAEE